MILHEIPQEYFLKKLLGLTEDFYQYFLSDDFIERAELNQIPENDILNMEKWITNLFKNKEEIFNAVKCLSYTEKNRTLIYIILKELYSFIETPYADRDYFPDHFELAKQLKKLLENLIKKSNEQGNETTA